jgi:hypothetical protein
VPISTQNVVDAHATSTILKVDSTPGTVDQAEPFHVRAIGACSGGPADISPIEEPVAMQNDADTHETFER